MPALLQRVRVPSAVQFDAGGSHGSPGAVSGSGGARGGLNYFREGDVATVAKAGSSIYGESVVVMNPHWNNLSGLVMVYKKGDPKSETKVYKSSDLRLARRGASDAETAKAATNVTNDVQVASKKTREALRSVRRCAERVREGNLIADEINAGLSFRMRLVSPTFQVSASLCISPFSRALTD